MPRLRLRVKVKPNARHAALLEQADGSWTAWLKSPAISLALVLSQ